MKDKSVIKWLYNITGKNRINILILLIVQALLGIICSFATENQTEQDAVQKMEEHKKARMKKIEFQIYAISVLLVL